MFRRKKKPVGYSNYSTLPFLTTWQDRILIARHERTKYEENWIVTLKGFTTAPGLTVRLTNVSDA